MNQNATQPIGIFDSGIGGLTVAHALTQVLPSESFIYFGDTAHLPYGDKSQAAIQAYSIKIAHFLLDKNVKAILIACNSASAMAFDLVKEYVASKALVFNVIDPVVQHVAAHYHGKNIGLIGTKATIGSRVYEKKLKEADPSAKLQSLATPLLASIIEEGFFNNSISKEIIQSYLGHPELEGTEALIPGCTHYPLIQTEIEAFYHGTIPVLDTASLVAKHVAAQLQAAGLRNPSTEPGKHHFFVSDFTQAFQQTAGMFFREQVHLELHRLWE